MGTPLPALEIAAVPFDPAALLDSLAAAAPAPRPDFSALEDRLRTGQSGPAVDPATGAPPADARATRDSVFRLSAELRRMDRTAPGYRAAYVRFRELYSRYSAREAARENALRSRTGGERPLPEQAARAADSLRAWERVAYQDFPRLAQERAAALGMAPQRITTDSGGLAMLELAPGRWWVNARLPDPENQFMEYQWNVVLTTAGLAFAVPLRQVNAARRWRH